MNETNQIMVIITLLFIAFFSFVCANKATNINENLKQIIQSEDSNMTDKEKRRYYTASVHFSAETMRQANELEQVLQESRSRMVSRAIDFMYQAKVNAAANKRD